MSLIKLFLVAAFACTTGYAQDLKVIDQDYRQALNIASRENKLLLIDFYTTWCVPCKKLDKLVFQNDSIRKILSKDVVLLRYNAENDTVFNLSKKHHIFIYPSSVILNSNGYVVNRNYGFPGEDFPSLSKSVLAFTDKAVENNRQKSFVKGYSNKIDISIYPKFYIDYVNRTNIKPAQEEIKKYFSEKPDIFSEGYFSAMLQFGDNNVPANIVDSILLHKEKFTDLYGKTDMDALLYIFARSKFDNAIAKKNKAEFDDAVLFVIKILDQNYASTINYFKKDFLQAEGKWDEVFKINEDLKNRGMFGDDAINNFCWTVYEKCDDMPVIKKCVSWMKELTDKVPDYTYLDTYAFLSYKSGNKEATKKITLLAIAAAQKSNASTKSLEALLKKL